MRILVCGGRDFSDYFYLRKVLQKHVAQIDTLIHGGARGADSAAKFWTEANGISQVEFKADWDQHGKAAGPIRNQQMIDEGHPDMVIAFPGGTGTADMIRRAEEAGIKVIRV